MAGLLDFIQGASNAAAGTVAGPVDLINMGLLGVGLPMPANPVGGSQWMRERGLMREPQNRVAGLLGEAAGNVLPIVAAAKAPQIAQGLLNHADAYRKYHAATTAPGAPATVWHGSPHRFDKFDSSKIGTGEGAQAYGHGLYFADNPAVARSYISAGQATKAPDRATEMVARALDASGGVDSKARAWLASRLQTSPVEFQAMYKRALDNFDALKPTGTLYRVDLPDDAIARMLDWDAPLSKQPEAVQKWAGKAFDQNFMRWVREGRVPALADAVGGDLYTMMGKSPDVAASLRTAGVPGIRYLDGGSRGAGAGTRNYVVLPGNEGLLKILGRE